MSRVKESQLYNINYWHTVLDLQTINYLLRSTVNNLRFNNPYYNYRLLGTIHNLQYHNHKHVWIQKHYYDYYKFTIREIKTSTADFTGFKFEFKKINNKKWYWKLETYIMKDVWQSRTKLLSSKWTILQ